MDSVLRAARPCDHPMDPTAMSSAHGPKSSAPSSSLKGVKASATATAGFPGPSVSSDPYYGYEGTSVLCASFVSSRMFCLTLNQSSLPIARSPPSSNVPTSPPTPHHACHHLRSPILWLTLFSGPDFPRSSPSRPCSSCNASKSASPPSGDPLVTACSSQLS
jgi:hypothetical protein